jgi:hypothetical protein
MPDARLPLAPRLQAAVEGVGIRGDTRAGGQRAWEPWLEQPWWHVVQPPQAPRATMLAPPAARGLRRGAGPAATVSLEAPALATLPVCRPASGLPW